MNKEWIEPNKDAVISYYALRRSVGVIGILLPFVLMLGTRFLFHEDQQTSISSYYYTGMRDVFVGTMCAFGIFLLCYRYGRLDNVVGNIAGVSAIGLALFPTSSSLTPTGWEATASWIHYGFAAVFFAGLAFFSFFLFTQNPAEKVRNTVYRICGIVIAGSLLLALVVAVAFDTSTKSDLRPLFWLETIAIVAFGVSWFVKGKTLEFVRSVIRGTAEPSEAGAK